ncbi:MAG: hypothetical protein ACT4PZ_12390 [Panacagrimonas sp.]
MSIYRSLLLGVGIAVACVSVSEPARAATPAEEIVQAVSELTPVQAGATLAAQILGEQLPPGLQLQLVQFLRDTLENPNGPNGPAHLEAFSEALVQAVLNTALNGQLLPGLASLGISIPGLPAGQMPTIKQVWDIYGVSKTAAFLVASLVVPDLQPIVLPSNVRTVGTYTKTATSTVTTGSPFTPVVTTNVTVGRAFTTALTLDIDAMVAIALDQNVVTDLVTVHSPLSTTVAVTVTCTQVTSALLGRRCINISTSTATTTNSKVLATNPTFTFAYPLNAGEFPTRPTAQDAFQIAYDALGSLYTQKARDPLFRSPFTGIPALSPLVPWTGVADLSTQAPPVNYFGLSTQAGSIAQTLAQGLVSPLLTAINQGQIRIREHAPSMQILDLDGAGALPGIPLSDLALGVTAGYQAAEVRTGQLSTMVVRWHNIGTSTVSETLNGVLAQLGLPSLPPLLLPSQPASIYYDVPAGEYVLTPARLDAAGAVYKVDWRVARPGYAIPVPPTLPSLGGLVTGLPGLLGSLGVGG